MKKVCFTKDRPSLRPEQANREVYIHSNLGRLDTPPNLPDEIPSVQYFEVTVTGVVAVGESAGTADAIVPAASPTADDASRLRGSRRRASTAMNELD